MNLEEVEPPREFPVGYEDIILRHAANIELEDDEMVTFVSGNPSTMCVRRVGAITRRRHSTRGFHALDFARL